MLIVLGMNACAQGMNTFCASDECSSAGDESVQISAPLHTHTQLRV